MPAPPSDLPPGEQDDNGIFLPNDLALYIFWRLEYLEERPALCQSVIDAQGRVCSLKVTEKIAIEKAACLAGTVAKEIDYSSGWRPWQVALLAVGSSIAFGAVGFFAGSIAR